MTPPRGRLVANLLSQMALGLLAMTICLPSMPSWQSTFSTDAAAVQLSFSSFVVAFGSLQLLYGPLSDRLGRQRILLVGLAVACGGSLLSALATSLPTLIAARALQGAGCAAGMVVGRALVQDLFQGPERTRVMAYVGMVMGLCPPLGTIVGGQLHARLGWQANFVLTAVLAAGLWLAAWRGLPSQTRATAPVGPWWPAMRASYARLAREPEFLLFVAILSLSTATFYTFLAGAPLVLRSQGVAPEAMGFYIMAVPLAYIVGNFFTTRLVHRLSGPALMTTGLTLTFTGLLTVTVLAGLGLNHPLALSLPLMLMGLGHGFQTPPTLAGTVGVLPALAGSAAAVAGLMQQLMGAAGGFAVGLVPHEGAFNLGWLMMLITGGAGVAFFFLRRRQRRSGG